MIGVADLRDVVKQCAERSKRFRRHSQRLGEQNTKANRLLLLRTPRLFIEAKGLGETLDDPRWANQTIAYATGGG